MARDGWIPCLQMEATRSSGQLATAPHGTGPPVFGQPVPEPADDSLPIHVMAGTHGT